MKKSIKFSIIMISIIVILSYFYISDQFYITQEDIKLKYVFSVEQDNITSYEIYIPIPYMPHIIEKKEGTFEIDELETDYGKVYALKASGKIKLVITGYEERYTIIENEIPGSYYAFSTQSDTNDDTILNWRDEYQCWIYQNKNSNISVSFLINIESNEDGYCGTVHNIYFEGNITPGWTQILLEEKGWCWDGYPGLHEYSLICLILIPIIIIIFIIGLIRFRKKEKRINKSNQNDNNIKDTHPK